MTNRASGEQPAANSLWLLTGLVILGLAGWCPGLLGPAWGGTLMMEAEVLEGSGAMAMPGAAPDPIRYAIVHHHRAQDQARLSTWLRTRSGSLVTFFTKDGVSHQAVLKRLKHCFGRGLLVYSDLVDLAEKDIVRLGLLVEETKP